jgi:hypothetical protein
VASQKDVLTRQFWSGRRIFLVADDMTSWRTAENPLHAVIQRPAPQVAPGQPVPQIPAPLPPLSTFVETASRSGCITAADVKQWGYHTSGSGILGTIAGRVQPTVILDGRREYGPIISGVFAEPQRPGKGPYVTPSSTDGVLVAWPPPPAFVPPGGEEA